MIKYRENLINQVKEHRDFLLSILETNGTLKNEHEICSKMVQNLNLQLNGNLINDTKLKSELTILNDLNEKLDTIQKYLNDFEKNMFTNFDDSYEILNSSFVGSLSYFMDNCYKTKFSRFNTNILVHRINFIKNRDSDFSSTLLLSKTLILNLYEDNTIEIYDFVNKIKLIDLKLENEVNFIRSHGKYILASFKCDEDEYQLNLLDFNLNKIKSAIFDYYYEFESMNDNEIIISVKTSFRILNWELHEVSSIELKDPYSNRFISPDHYWLFCSNEQNLFVWKHDTNNIDIFNKVNGEFMKSVRVENLYNSEFAVDLNSCLILFNYELNEVHILNLKFETLFKSVIESNEKIDRDDTEMFITSDNQITISNTRRECFYVI